VIVATTTLGVAAALGAIGTCILIAALIGKELSTSYEDEDHKPATKERLKSLIGSLNIAITPMLMIFALIVTVKVMVNPFYLPPVNCCCRVNHRLHQPQLGAILSWCHHVHTFRTCGIFIPYGKK